MFFKCFILWIWLLDFEGWHSHLSLMWYSFNYMCLALMPYGLQGRIQDFQIEGAQNIMCMQRIFWPQSVKSFILKGKFSSGIEGALASTLNHDFNWKQLSEIILCIFLLMFSMFIWVLNIDSETAEIINKKRLWILGVGVAFYYDLKYNR